MRLSWTFIVTLVLAAWLGSTSTAMAQQKDGNIIDALTATNSSIGAKGSPNLREIVLVERLDFGIDNNGVPMNFANCSSDQCCCTVGSDTKCTAKADCSSAGGKCVKDKKCKAQKPPKWAE
jgi:hypothetical protein